MQDMRTRHKMVMTLPMPARVAAARPAGSPAEEHSATQILHGVSAGVCRIRILDKDDKVNQPCDS